MDGISKMNLSLTIGTRGSQLALWQAQFVQQQLNVHFPEVAVSLKIIKTTGDAIQNRSLLGLGKGVFTKEIETALLNGQIDLAVHSLKDLPTELPDGLHIAAIPAREDARDVLVTRAGMTLAQLPEHAKIGTTSPRRKAQLLHVRPALDIVEVRGNIDTRLRKLHETDLDGIVLAAAGIKRLYEQDFQDFQDCQDGQDGQDGRARLQSAPTGALRFLRGNTLSFFDVDMMVPAVGQGALAIEARADDNTVAEHLAPLNEARAAAEVTAERTVLENLGGGCHVPIGANAKHVNGQLSLIGCVCHPNGTERIVEQAIGTPDDAQHLGEVVAEKLRNSGAAKLLSVVREAFG